MSKDLTSVPRFPLLTGTPDGVLRTHGVVDRLLRRCAQHQARSAAFDLTNVNDVDPGGMLLLMYAGLVVGRRDTSLMAYGDSEAMRKLAKNLTHYRLNWKDRASFPRDHGTYPMRQVKDPDSMVSELEDWAQTVKLDTSVKDENVAVWGMQIGEVVTNSFQHGPTAGVLPTVMLCGGIQNGRVQLAALDTGRGIPSSIEKTVTPDIKAGGHSAMIRRACDMGITARTTPVNQGYGLPHLVDLVKTNGGSLVIFSQRGLVHLRNGKLYKRRLESTERSLDGTLTIVSLCV